jgi:hypothetical protein
VLRRHGLRVRRELPRRLRRRLAPRRGVRRGLLVGAVRVEPEAGVHGEEGGDAQRWLGCDLAAFPAPERREGEGEHSKGLVQGFRGGERPTEVVMGWAFNGPSV